MDRKLVPGKNVPVPVFQSSKPSDGTLSGTLQRRRSGTLQKH